MPIDLAVFGDRQLDDLHLDPRDALVLQEQRLGDMVGHALDQGEVHPCRQRGGRRALQIEIGSWSHRAANPARNAPGSPDRP